MACRRPVPIIGKKLNTLLHTAVDCMKWDCPDCLEQKKKLTFENLKHAIRQNKYLYIGVVEIADWNRIYRRLGDYYRIEIGNKRAYLVISTNPFPFAHHQIRHNCLSVARKTIERLKKRPGVQIYQPVSHSRSWSPEKRESTMERVCIASAAKFTEACNRFKAAVTHCAGSICAKFSPENLEKCVCFLTNIGNKSIGTTDIRQLIDENERFWAEKLGSKYVPLAKLAQT